MYRLLSLENEIDNEELCDFSIRTDDMEEAVEQVKAAFVNRENR